MKQQFELSDNTDALVVLGVLSGQFDEKTPTVDYQYNGSISPGSAVRNVLVVKSRFVLPQVTSVYSSNSAELASATDMSQVTPLVADSTKAEIYLADNYAGSDESLIHDSDLAPFKAKADVVIKSFSAVDIGAFNTLTAADFNYQFYVNNSLVFNRNAGASTQALADWIDRTKESSGRDPVVVKGDDSFEITTNDSFFQGSNIKLNKQNTPGAECLLLRSYTDVDGKVFLTSYIFALPSVLPQVDFYHYCAKGKDENSQWCRTPLSMEMDTIEIFPDQGFVYLTWRCNWANSAIAFEQYRALRVRYKANQLQEAA